MLVRLLFIWVFLLSCQVLASAEGMYIHTDGLGSPVARTNQQGQVISRTRYEPYGAAAAGATPTIGFTGHVNDPDTGLIYMQQRYYDPYAGRFLSTDPVLTDANTGGSFNRYIYANNNPFRYIDPDGRAASDPYCSTGGGCYSDGSGNSKKAGSDDAATKTAAKATPHQISQGAMVLSEQEFLEHTKGDKNWLSYKNLKVMFPDGQMSEIDRLYVNPATNEAVCIECKTGPNAKYTPTQRNHVDDLAKGRYMIKTNTYIPGYNPGFFLGELYTVRYQVFGVNTFRISRSPTTEALRQAGATIKYRTARGGAVIAP